MARLKLGLFGGSFDPPHLGHLHVAAAALEELGLDQIRLIPAARPPHKLTRALADDTHRRAMTELLAREHHALAVDPRELSRGGTSYTIDTLLEMRREAGSAGADLYFLIGSDSLVDLPTWQRADELVDLATFVTIPRDEASVELGMAQLRTRLPAAVDRIAAHLLHAEPLPISSSQIRMRVRAGQAIEELVPRSIADYVRHHRLYRDRADSAGAS